MGFLIICILGVLLVIVDLFVDIAVIGLLGYILMLIAHISFLVGILRKRKIAPHCSQIELSMENDIADNTNDLSD